MSEASPWPRERGLLRLFDINWHLHAMYLQLDTLGIGCVKLPEDAPLWPRCGRYSIDRAGFYSRVFLTATLVLL
jgi:hypothetical protein